MNYKKPAFWLIFLSLLAVILAAICLLTDPQTHETLEWAQELSADDVDYIELVVLPQSSDKQYKLYSGESLAEIVTLINNSKGNLMRDHEELDGKSIFFYLTMKDGSTHTFGNMGNVYLVIDGDYYEAPYQWLVTWDGDFGEGDSSLPPGFFTTSKDVARTWVDYYDSPEEMTQISSLETELPEFPGVTFQYNMGQVIVTNKNGHTILISGMPIWNVFFSDLTGDGSREICATVSYGSGIVDTHVVVIDYAAVLDGSEHYEYTLWERGQYDYVLCLKNGNLICEQWVYPDGELVTRGKLMLKSNALNMKYLAINPPNIKVPLSNSPADLRGYHHNYLYVPINGLTYRYEISGMDPETVTANNLLDKFTAAPMGELFSELDIWKVYSVNEYPDYSVLLMVTDDGNKALFQHCPSKGVNASALQNAKDMGCVIIENGDVTFGQQ